MSTALLVPKTMNEAIRYSKLLAQSSMVPKQFQGKPEDILVAVQWGAEVGLPAMSALQNIAVINGRPAIYGDAALALVTGHPEYAGHKEWIEGETAHCLIKREVKGNIVETERTFSVGEAKRAGLANKSGPWRQYPNRMLQMRARGFAIRDAFPDAVKGVSIDDDREIKEVQEIVPENPLDIIQPKEQENPSPVEDASEQTQGSDRAEVQEEPDPSPEETVEDTEDLDLRSWELILGNGEVQEFASAEKWVTTLQDRFDKISVDDAFSYDDRRHIISVLKKENDDTIDRLKDEYPDQADELGKEYIKLIKFLSIKVKEETDK